MSNINSADIEKDFPEPGKDNDSSGFRNNFRVIAENFDAARSEVIDLQTNAARTDTNNNFNQNNIANANLVATTGEVFDHGNIDSNTTVSFLTGSYHKAGINANLSLIFSDWPSQGTYAKITVELQNNSNSFQTVNWSTEQGGTIIPNLGIPVQLYDSTDGSNVRLNAFPDPLVVDPDSRTYVLEFWTADGGTNVYANFVGEFADV